MAAQRKLLSRRHKTPIGGSRYQAQRLSNAGKLKCERRAILAALALGGCQAAAEARRAAYDDSTCRGYGAQPGTDIYVQCRMAAEQNRSARQIAGAQCQMVAQQNYRNTVAAKEPGASEPMLAIDGRETFESHGLAMRIARCVPGPDHEETLMTANSAINALLFAGRETIRFGALWLFIAIWSVLTLTGLVVASVMILDIPYSAEARNLIAGVYVGLAFLYVNALLVALIRRKRRHGH